MTIGLKRIGIGALVLALALVVGLLGPGLPQDSSEAALQTPGGITAMPSALPGLPLVMNQQIPAISPASGPGSKAVVGVFCDDDLVAPGPCPDTELGVQDGVENINFEITKVHPSDVPVGATFDANGGTFLKCADGSTCDDNFTPGSVFVQLAGGGINEVVMVTATDESGAARSVNIIFTETIFAVAPVNSGTATSSTLVSYRCPDVGSLASTRDPVVPNNLLTGLDWEAYLENMYNGIGGGATDFIAKRLSLFYPCGGDTPGNPIDDRVNFETDVAILSVEEMTVLGTVTNSCDAGDSVDVLDSPGLIGAAPGQLCDLDFAPNGVVTYGLLGTGDIGVASVTGQQSGGGGVLRTINVTFAGVAAMSLFIQPVGTVGAAGGEFNVLLVDQDGRPLSGQTVECSVDPVGGALLLVPQTGTSDANGNVNFLLVPTGASVAVGAELIVTCFLDSNPDVKASHTFSLSFTPGTEMVDLAEGCNPVSSTWADGTDIGVVADAVAPADNLTSIWQLADPAAGAWNGFSPDVPASENDLTDVGFLDSIVICTSGAATVERPEVLAP